MIEITLLWGLGLSESLMTYAPGHDHSDATQTVKPNKPSNHSPCFIQLSGDERCAWVGCNLSSNVISPRSFRVTSLHRFLFVVFVIMMTSLNGNIFRVTGPLCGEFTGPGEFPTQRPVTRSFDVSLICVWINGWINNREAGDLRRYRAHSDVIVM